jgi:membrane-bound serine protease (ClpP class)
MVLVVRAAKEPPAPTGPLVLLAVKGPIGAAVKEYLHGGLGRAARDKAAGVVLALDTPGGLLEATRDIVQDILNAPFPVVVYVSPQGARATSAGLFITLAADVAAMAPETHLGAAHPVSLGFSLGKDKDGDVMAEKALSDTAAFARTLAADHGRDAVWAEKAVRESLSLTAEEALAKKVVDLVAADLDEVLADLRDAHVDKNGVTYSLNFDKCSRVSVEMTFSQRWLGALGHPNVAYLLLILGFYALIYEFSSPGIGMGGAVGVVCLTLAFFSLQALPLNYAGLFLVSGGVIMMALDHFLAGHGFLLTGGALSLAVGSFMLFDSAEPYYRVSGGVIAGVLAFAGAFSYFFLRLLWRDRGRVPLTGSEGLVGAAGVLVSPGQALVHGERWEVKSREELKSGDRVKVLEVMGLTLWVEKT